MPVRPVMTWDYNAQPKESVSACNLCGDRRFVVMGVRDRYKLPVQTHGCLTCGLLFANPRMTGAAYAAFYADGHYRDLLRATGRLKLPENELKALQIAYAQSLADFLAPFVGPGRSVLDVGGAPGLVARTLMQLFKFSSVRIVDPAPCDAYPGISIWPETFEGHAPDSLWDVVLMCQTVDHLLDLRGSLEKAWRLLKDDGLFFVDVAELRRSLAWYKTGLLGVLKVDHPYCIAEEVMEYALRTVGFEVIRKTYAMSAWHVGYLCRKSVPARATFPDAEALMREVRR